MGSGREASKRGVGGGILLSPVARLGSDLLLTRVRRSWND